VLSQTILSFIKYVKKNINNYHANFSLFIVAVFAIHSASQGWVAGLNGWQYSKELEHKTGTRRNLKKYYIRSGQGFSDI
jgi:hypothetical protein